MRFGMGGGELLMPFHEQTATERGHVWVSMSRVFVCACVCVFVCLCACVCVYVTKREIPPFSDSST